MLDFELINKDTSGSVQTVLRTKMRGKLLLTTPQLNKGTAFSEQERNAFGLLGKLPEAVESLEDQVNRCYKQYSSFHTNLQKNIYLNSLHETNEVLFYKLVQEHVAEMLPVIYTPVVGTKVKEFSAEFRQARGLYISYPNRDKMLDILQNRSHPNIELIVCTDGEGVLGIGDQGIGAIDIPIAKLMVYSIAGGINPLNTLPIMLDAGTNNPALLNDPMYLGWRHERVQKEDYDSFIEQFVDSVKKSFPDIYLHWEDFGSRNARVNLERYRESVCSFNDDIQGTGVVTLAALLAAVEAAGSNMADQRVVVFGAGSAGIGISDQLRDAMIRHGLDHETAMKRFYLLNSQGLLLNDRFKETDVRYPYSYDRSEISDWQIDNPDNISLLDVVRNVKPTILIGCSTVAGAFDEAVITEMAKHTERPIIFPLSNPTEKSEAHPKNLLRWTNGKALIASGSPFDPVKIEDKLIPIAQCNNALVFPGIGLGILATKASKLTDDMLWEAVKITSKAAPIRSDEYGALLPALDACAELSEDIAIAVGKQAIKDGLSDISESDLEAKIKKSYWEPSYLAYELDTED